MHYNMSTEKEDLLLLKLKDPTNDSSYFYSDQLAEIGTAYILDQLILLLSHENNEVKYLSARTIGLIENNSKAYDPLLNAITDKTNKACSGGLTEALEGFDCSDKFVDIFKLYLFGNLKTSGLAKRMLDYEEFNITPRVIRKSEKHWTHFKNNVKQDEGFEVTKIEVESRLNELKSMFEEEQNK